MTKSGKKLALCPVTVFDMDFLHILVVSFTLISA